ncbi:CotH kinase family protein [Sorangium sp. So ce1000]|uniref:CotH kinase family protein n=1 Tax=Sorangium sp. So ce1000 TaxID=3133325 RepID=UPI003F5D8D4F
MNLRILGYLLPFATLAAAPLLGCGSSEEPGATGAGAGASGSAGGQGAGGQGAGGQGTGGQGAGGQGAGGQGAGGQGAGGQGAGGQGAGGQGAGGQGAGGAGGDGEAGGTATEPPDYAAAFPQDRVPRIDITVAPDQWQQMIDDMTDMAGEFGAQPGGFAPPPEWVEACNGLIASDACTISLFGTDTKGTCTDVEGELACMPAGPGGGDPGLISSVELFPRTPVYVECDVATEDRQWKHVGIRFKGNSSLLLPWGAGNWKLPLRLNFDRYEDAYPEIKNQRFYGFDMLSFASGYLDPSLLREKIGTDIFAKAGIPAPATAFYRVFIDHGEGPVYFGLYTGIEIPSDESFLDTHFGGHKGNLYKPDGTGARWATWDPDTIVKENNEDNADTSDARALFDALHEGRTDAAAWRAGLEARLDVDGFLHWLALNAVIEDWDVYGRLPHNYYLYSDPNKGGQFTWIPWDHTFAFTDPDSPGANIGVKALSLSMSEVSEQWPLVRYLLDDPVYLEVYRGYVAQAAAEEYEPAAAEAWFKAAHDLIAPYVVGPEGEIEGHTHLAAPEDFESGLATLIAHAKGRAAEVATFLGQ